MMCITMGRITYLTYSKLAIRHLGLGTSVSWRYCAIGSSNRNNISISNAIGSSSPMAEYLGDWYGRHGQAGRDRQYCRARIKDQVTRVATRTGPPMPVHMHRDEASLVVKRNKVLVGRWKRRGDESGMGLKVGELRSNGVGSRSQPVVRFHAMMAVALSQCNARIRRLVLSKLSQAYLP